VDAEVRSVLVFRALDLGDMLCAVPAFRALRQRYREARIALVGLPWAGAFVDRFDYLIDEFIEFPGYPGLPEQPFDSRRWEAFLRDVRTRRFDLAIQLHGSGAISNQVVSQLGAETIAGWYPNGTLPPPAGAFTRWVDHLSEVEQCLRIIDALRLQRAGTYLEFRSRPSDHREFASFGLGNKYVVLHCGAKWPSRRWPAESFAELARRLASKGMPVVLTGVQAERHITARVREFAGETPIDLAGETSLGGFAEVLRKASLVVTNDTGASHLAVAVGTPSVVVACGSDTARWAPLDSTRHRTLSLSVACRPCSFESCPYGHECADVGVDIVERHALELLDSDVRASLGNKKGPSVNFPRALRS
jgi:ADP-heptose:LPS heptosyltransferase